MRNEPSHKTIPEEAPPHPLRFTERQNHLITRSITIVSCALAAGVLWWLMALLAAFVDRHNNILLPPVAAIVLAMICKPLYDRFASLYRGSHVLSVVSVIVVVFVPLGLFLWFFGDLAISQAIRLLDRLPELSDRLHAATEERLPELRYFLQERGLLPLLDSLNPDTWVDELLKQVGDSAYLFGSRVLSFLGGVIGWMVLPVYTAFFLATRPLDGSDMRKLLVFATPKTRDNVAFLVDQFLGIVVTFFRGQVLVAFLQGVLFGIGFQLVGLDYGLLLGLTLGLLNIVPYLGNLIGLSITLPLAIFGESGGIPRLLWVLSVFLCVQTLDNYLITPRIMGNRTGLSAFVVIFSLFFWNAVIGGMLGMFLAIPLSAFIVVFWRLLKREYFPKEFDRMEPPDHHAESPLPEPS